MNDDMRMVYESSNRSECSDRALVLAAVQIPFQVVDDIASCALVVPAEFSAQAMQELIQYDDENPPQIVAVTKPLISYNAVPGLVAYVVILCTVAVIADFASPDCPQILCVSWTIFNSSWL